MRKAAIAIVYFFLAIASREMFRHLPQGVSTPAWKLGWLLFCFAGLWLAHRQGGRAAVRELGLDGAVLRGLGVTLAATSPMLVVLFLVARQGIVFDPRVMLESVVLAALTEEILFRGYLFRQLYRRAGWGFVPAVLVTGLLFGIAHVSSVIRGGVIEVFGVVGITTVGGIFFAWLFIRWNDNLWVPIGAHLFMNAWWELFAVSPDAIGNVGGNLARGIAVAGLIVVTLRLTCADDSRSGSKQSADPAAPPNPENVSARSI